MAGYDKSQATRDGRARLPQVGDIQQGLVLLCGDRSLFLRRYSYGQRSYCQSVCLDLVNGFGAIWDDEARRPSSNLIDRRTVCHRTPECDSTGRVSLQNLKSFLWLQTSDQPSWLGHM